MNSQIINNARNVFFLFLAVFIFSCSNKPVNNLSVYRALNSSLNSSNNFITSQNLSLMKSIERELADPLTSQKAIFWYPKAAAVQQRSREIIEYIDSLKVELKKEAGLKIVNDREWFREDDMSATSNLFDRKGNGEKLKQRLLKFENDVLAIDPEINSLFKNTIHVIISLNDPSENTQKTFTEIFFQNTPTLLGLAVLSKFQNNIKIMENEVIAFCDNKIPK